VSPIHYITHPVPPPQKKTYIFPLLWGSKPPSDISFLAPTQPTTSNRLQHLDPVSHFLSTAWSLPVDGQTSRTTTEVNRCEHASYAVCAMLPINRVCVCVCVCMYKCRFVWFIHFSKSHQPADELYGAVSDSHDLKLTLAKAARLLNELATTLSQLQEAEPSHQYTHAANEPT